MTVVPCSNKVLVFMLVAILLLIECTNLAKAENQADKIYDYDSYEYPGYQYPDQNSRYNLFSWLCRFKLTTVKKWRFVWSRKRK